MPRTLLTWQPLTLPLPPLGPRRSHTPTPISTTAQPCSLQRTQEAVALSKKITHTAYIVTVVDSHMLNSCLDLERHLFDDVFRAFF